MIKYRNGLIVLGNAGFGKSSIIEILSSSQTEIPSVIHYNPKGNLITNMFGSTNSLTNEWEEGLLGFVVKKANEVNKANS
jgi:hypothetical protein